MKWNARIGVMVFALAAIPQARAADGAPVAGQPGAPIIIAIAPTNITPATHRAAQPAVEAPVAYTADFASNPARISDGSPRVVSGPETARAMAENLPVQEPSKWGRFRSADRPWSHFERFPGIR